MSVLCQIATMIACALALGGKGTRNYLYLLCKPVYPQEVKVKGGVEVFRLSVVLPPRALESITALKRARIFQSQLW